MKKKQQSPERVEYKKAFKEIEVKVKNRTKVSQYFYDCARDLVECKPGKTIKYIERLETIYIPVTEKTNGKKE